MNIKICFLAILDKMFCPLSFITLSLFLMLSTFTWMFWFWKSSIFNTTGFRKSNVSDSEYGSWARLELYPILPNASQVWIDMNTFSGHSDSEYEAAGLLWLLKQLLLQYWGQNAPVGPSRLESPGIRGVTDALHTISLTQAPSNPHNMPPAQSTLYSFFLIQDSLKHSTMFQIIIAIPSDSQLVGEKEEPVKHSRIIRWFYSCQQLSCIMDCCWWTFCCV